MPLLEVAIIIAVAGLAAVVQSLTGFGFGLLIVPPLVLILGPRDAVVLSNVLATGLAGLMLLRLYRDVEWRTGSLLLLCSIVGMPAGFVVLVSLDARVLQVLIALSVIVFTIVLVRGVTLGSRPTMAGTAVAGVLAGVLRTSTSMSGPPIVLYLQGAGMASAEFRATLAAFFFASGALAVALFAVEGTLDAGLGLSGIVTIPAVLAGLEAGGRLYRHVSEERFRSLVFAVLIASALAAIAGAFF
ncbi:MAG: sulfite exporter TauE/SafE family protein [Dehalococcoidia bacterium]|nr:sulfite exporter TauE/SafE family protein [Dehalococcoidia bacterium]